MFPTAEEASESKENSFRRHSFLRRVGNIWHGVREKAPTGARRGKSTHRVSVKSTHRGRGEKHGEFITRGRCLLVWWVVVVRVGGSCLDREYQSHWTPLVRRILQEAEK